MLTSYKYQFAIFILVIFSIVVLIERAILGVEFISDEVFYLNSDIDLESKRIIFIYLSQLFDNVETNFYFIVCLNLILLILCYRLLVKINRHEVITFLQLLYMPVIASFILRDLYILYFTLLSILCMDGFFRNDIFGKLKTMFIFIITSFLLLDFRPQMIAIICLSFVFVLATRSFSIKKTIYCIFISIAIFLILLPYILDSYKIYGITLGEYLNMREQRFGGSYSTFTIYKSLAVHYLAPIPSSLLSRILEPDIDGVYRHMDDIFRFLYRIALYVMYFYVLINYKYIIKVIYFNKERFFLVFNISICNAVIYSIFSFGGGHERVKLISMLIVFYVASMISNIKRNCNE